MKDEYYVGVVQCLEKLPVRKEQTSNFSRSKVTDARCMRLMGIIFWCLVWDRHIAELWRWHYASWKHMVLNWRSLSEENGLLTFQFYTEDAGWKMPKYTNSVYRNTVILVQIIKSTCPCNKLSGKPLSEPKMWGFREYAFYFGSKTYTGATR